MDDAVDDDGLFADECAAIFHACDERHLLQQAAQTLGVGVAAFYELHLLLLAERYAREQGFETHLYGGYGSLELVVDVIGELAFEAVFLLLGFVVVDALNVLAQLTGSEIGHDTHGQAYGYHYQQKSPVGFEQGAQGTRVWDGRAHDDPFAPRGRVEVLSPVAGGVAPYVVTRAMLEGSCHLRTAVVIVERVYRDGVVVDDRSREGDECYAQVVEGFLMRGYILFVRFALLDGHQQMVVVLLQLGAQELRLVLLLPQILESNEA